MLVDLDRNQPAVYPSGRVKAWVVAEPKAIDDGPLASGRRGPTPPTRTDNRDQREGYRRERVIFCFVFWAAPTCTRGGDACDSRRTHPPWLHGQRSRRLRSTRSARACERFRPVIGRIAWLRHTGGQCRWCRYQDSRTLHPWSKYTGTGTPTRGRRGGRPSTSVRVTRCRNRSTNVNRGSAAVRGHRRIRRVERRPRCRRGGRLGIYGFARRRTLSRRSR